jgi:hypothetical protein
MSGTDRVCIVCMPCNGTLDGAAMSSKKELSKMAQCKARSRVHCACLLGQDGLTQHLRCLTCRVGMVTTLCGLLLLTV